ncbi:MAG: transposase [Candidatus Omnitrophota bacterium]
MKNIKNIRLEHYNYRENGYYFVTVCANYKNNTLIDETKNVVARFIEQVSEKIKGVKVDYYIIMPNHIHLILVLDNCRIKLGEIIRRLKAVSSKETGYRLWQPNYYEHIIRNEKALEKIREYIINNPEVERLKFEEFYIAR